LQGLERAHVHGAVFAGEARAPRVGGDVGHQRVVAVVDGDAAAQQRVGGHLAAVVRQRPQVELGRGGGGGVAADEAGGAGRAADVDAAALGVAAAAAGAAVGPRNAGRPGVAARAAVAADHDVAVGVGVGGVRRGAAYGGVDDRQGHVVALEQAAAQGAAPAAA